MNCKLCNHPIEDHIGDGDDRFDCMLCTCVASSNDLEDEDSLEITNFLPDQSES